MSLTADSLAAADSLARWWRRHRPSAALPRLGPATGRVVGRMRGKIGKAMRRARLMVSGEVGGVRRVGVPAGRARSPSGGARFMPPAVARYIDTHIRYYLVYTCVWMQGGSRRTVRLRFAVYTSLELADRVPFDEMAARALSWIFVCSQTAPEACSRELDVHLLRAPHAKRLPSSRAQILGPAHVNSGYASACPRTGEIVVFREEEWFKVFVHETFHAFYLDAGAGAPALKELSRALLPVPASHSVQEAYTETWARIINALYCLDSVPDAEFGKACAEFLTIERMFGVAQASKVLEYMGTSFECLRREDAGQVCGYNENTNVLSYYIVAGALMHDLEKFMGWCSRNAIGFIYFKSRPRADMAFGQLLVEAIEAPSFAAEMESARGWPGRGRSSRRVALADTLRMTALECECSRQN